jgi:hypothetical protein
MTSTSVPGIFVRSQLSCIPGEERKFKRRAIVALIPTCRRDRFLAVSQEDVTGISARGVAVDSTRDDPVGAGSVAAIFVGDGMGEAVTVGGMDVGAGEVEIVGGLVLNVAEGLEGIVPVRAETVATGVKACVAGRLSRYKKRINRMMATINLKMS